MTGTKKCRCTHHNIALQRPLVGKEKKFLNWKNTKIHKKARTRLVSKNLLHHVKSGEKTFICEMCIEYILNDSEYNSIPNVAKSGEKKKSKRGRPSNYKGNDSNNELSLVDMLIQKILNRQLTENELCRISNAVGFVISDEIKTKAALPPSDRISNLQSYSYESHYTLQNKVLRSFLEGIVDFRFEHEEKQKRIKVYLSKAIDSVLHAANSNFISITSLGECLLMYAKSGSQICCDIMGHGGNSGSYDTVRKTFRALASPLPTLPDGDICIAFDNNQMLKKNYVIKLDSKLRTSVVTTMSAYQFQSNLQCTTPMNAPMYWDMEISSSIFQQVLHFEEQTNDLHGKFRLSFIDDRIRKIVRELESIDDLFDLDGKNSKEEKNYSMDYERVLRFPSSCKIVDQPCLPVNPNSYESVTVVLNHILDTALENRKWVVVVCDGLPYGIAKEIIYRTFICDQNGCGIEIHKDKIDEHYNEHHPETTRNVHRKYEKIVLRPGNGHFELNFTRTLMSSYFDIYIEPVAVACGFRKLNQLAYIKKAHNHHLSWQLLQVVFEALADELVREYVVHQLQNDRELSVHSYIDWSKNNENPNFKAAESFTFTWLHSLFLFRAGIRQCNDEVALAAREKLSSIFYGFNNPKYREYNCSDVFWLLSLPEESKSISGMQSTRREKSESGQAQDFLLEERVKAQKNLVISNGIPSNDDWLIASGVANKIDEIRDWIFPGLGIGGQSTEKRRINLNTEINAARKIYRESGIFSGTQKKEFTNVSKSKKLTEEFLDCVNLCETNKLEYYEAHLQRKKPCIRNVIRTEDERESSMITNTKSEIITAIKEKITLLPDSSAVQYKKLNLTTSKDELCSILEAIQDEILEFEWNEDVCNVLIE